MDVTRILITLVGIIGIGFTYWFFLMKKEDIIVAEGSIDITVKGGYSPSVISIKKGQKTKINFMRTDPNSCLEDVVLADFKIRKFLPLNTKVSIEITPEKTGEYPFTCGMNMFHGKIIVT